MSHPRPCRGTSATLQLPPRTHLPSSSSDGGSGYFHITDLGVVGHSLMTTPESTISNHPSHFNRERCLKCRRSHQLDQKAPVLNTRCCFLPLLFSSRPEDGANNSSFLLGALSCTIYTSTGPSTTAFQFWRQSSSINAMQIKRMINHRALPPIQTQRQLKIRNIYVMNTNHNGNFEAAR